MPLRARYCHDAADYAPMSYAASRCLPLPCHDADYASHAAAMLRCLPLRLGYAVITFIDYAAADAAAAMRCRRRAAAYVATIFTPPLIR